MDGPANVTIQRVIDGGYCIGCGACSLIEPRIRVDFNDYGDLQAVLPPGLDDRTLRAAAEVCPFATTVDESQIGDSVFGSAPSSHPRIGRYEDLRAGYAPSTRAGGSSGGIVTWLLQSLLERGDIDAAIHVGPAEGSSRFFDYRLSSDSTSIQQGATSFYYPVSMDQILAIVRSRPGRYAITGVPCFHKALRRLRAVDSVLDARIRFQIGIVCGQMKSAHYMDYLVELAGGKSPVAQACFRRKVPGRPANDYAFEAIPTAKAGSPAEPIRLLNSRIGINWGMGYFKPEACDYCDDVLAETADIAAMDAWLPRYVSDGDGWSLVVTRKPELVRLLDDAQEQGSLVGQQVSADDVVGSQQGGFNHRQDALPYRLHLKRNSEAWVPPKRQEASGKLPFILKIEQRLRMRLRRRSREMWLLTGAVGQTAKFVSCMSRDVFAYRQLMRVKRWLNRLAG
ncbi:MAG: Coenzyme F420 hydrogenase/dehydrogenase, beta subunit C-terminal domain [Rhodoferax sp.]|nr:Coenzyme F420 hydrogenase/dehydrogenase, beta subunit C-terminal domain [Rhodoferax sp.]